MSMKQFFRLLLVLIVLLETVVSFDVGVYCQRRCSMGSGGILCDCTQGHFKGKRGFAPSGSMTSSDSIDTTYSNSQDEALSDIEDDLFMPNMKSGRDSDENVDLIPTFLYKALADSTGLENDDVIPRETRIPVGHIAFHSANRGNGLLHQPSVLKDGQEKYGPYPYLSPNFGVRDAANSGFLYSYNNAVEKGISGSNPRSRGYSSRILALLQRVNSELNPNGNFQDISSDFNKNQNSMNGHAKEDDNESKWDARIDSKVVELPYLILPGGDLQSRDSRRNAAEGVDGFQGLVDTSAVKPPRKPQHRHLHDALSLDRRLQRTSRSSASGHPA